MSMGTVSIGGASAPFTVAGCMTHSLATDLAGMTLSQLVRKGSFCAGSSENTFMEPVRGRIGNATRDFWADIATRQVRTRLGLVPFSGAGEVTYARRFNQDAVLEISTGLMSAFYIRPTTLDYMGILDGGMSFSLHALLLCDDLAGMLRCLWDGIVVDEEHLALDVTRAVGPKGNYLGQKHTAKHCRINYWDSRYFEAKFPLMTTPDPNRDLVARIDDDLREILASHRPEPMPAPMQKEIGAIHAKFQTD
jgi:trimethylamine:corrinoid methyltransferase-like protein